MNDFDLLIIGAGPAGYACAFAAADFGLKIALIDERGELGGVCLHEGCIPSKSLLNLSRVLDEAKNYSNHGILKKCELEVDLPRLRDWIKNEVIGSLSKGLANYSSLKKIHFIQGRAKLVATNAVEVALKVYYAKNIVIATGSYPVKLPFLQDHEDILDSTSALNLRKIPENLLILGGGAIGCEMANIYSALGSMVTVCDILPNILSSCDPDMSNLLLASLKEKYKVNFLLSTKCLGVESLSDGFSVQLENNSDIVSEKFEQILICVGRRANTFNLGLEDLGVKLNTDGCISINDKFQTNIEGIYALGDVAGAHFAHHASHMARMCAEIIANKGQSHVYKSLPSVVYTSDELAWVGKTERDLEGTKYFVKTINWQNNGRAVSCLHQGLTKIILNNDGMILGAAIFGQGAGEMISEISLAIEMGSHIQDLRLTMHPHPTISESLMDLAELFNFLK